MKMKTCLKLAALVPISFAIVAIGTAVIGKICRTYLDPPSVTAGYRSCRFFFCASTRQPIVGCIATSPATIQPSKGQMSLVKTKRGADAAFNVQVLFKGYPQCPEPPERFILRMADNTLYGYQASWKLGSMERHVDCVGIVDLNWLKGK